MLCKCTIWIKKTMNTFFAYFIGTKIQQFFCDYSFVCLFHQMHFFKLLAHQPIGWCLIFWQIQWNHCRKRRAIPVQQNVHRLDDMCYESILGILTWVASRIHGPNRVWIEHIQLELELALVPTASFYVSLWTLPHTNAPMLWCYLASSKAWDCQRAHLLYSDYQVRRHSNRDTSNWSMWRISRECMRPNLQDYCSKRRLSIEKMK